MDALPPAALGAIILVSFLPALAFRGSLESRLILNRSLIRQPSRQLYLDLALCLASGVIAGFWVEAIYGFPMVTGYKLVFGALAGGFYVSLDMAFERQRRIIDFAASSGHYDAPGKLEPLTRKFVAAAVTALVLTSAILGLIWINDVWWLVQTAERTGNLAMATRTILFEIVFVLGATLFAVVRLILRFSDNLALLFQSVTSVLEKVRRGDLDSRVPVATADEFGLIASRTNDMIEGLGHRMRLLDALKVAEEVQRGLLPDAPPVIPGLDIWAESRYCDETGGDYYDFFRLSDGAVAFVAGDVSGHGVGPALLMASARAYLRLAGSLTDDPARAVAAANARVTGDVYGAGRFVTLFLFAADPDTRSLRWVRAGHDPGLLYDPATDSFTELWGAGLPLGVAEDAAYALETLAPWPSNGLVFAGTDGIWETRGPDGSMFGKDRLRATLRENADASAREIVRAVFAAVEAFRGEGPVEDDVTAMAVKLP